MGRLADCFSALRSNDERALIPFVTAGDRDLETTHDLVLAMADAGADAIEIGVPFSDPMAEGPTIQRASERALAARTTLRGVLQLVAKLRPQLDVPLVLMGYANNFLAMGDDGFAQATAEVGVDGVITVDLPPEEGAETYTAMRNAGVDPILLAAPTTQPDRLARLAQETRGFLYFVSLTGVTGARSALSESLAGEVKAIRALSDVPVCVGFGVSTPEHAAEVGRFADGVVVGSAIVDRIERAPGRKEAVEGVARFVGELKAALR